MVPVNIVKESERQLSDIDFVFIIGAPRSGTTWLQAMIAAHPSVASTVDELKLFDLFTVPLEEGWQFLLNLQKDTKGSRNGLTAMWTDRDFYGFLSDFVGKVYGQVAALNPDATVLLDKAPAYSKYVDHIEKLIPKPKFIHIIRDGRDVAVSLMSAAQGWGRLWAPNKVKRAASTWKTYVLAAQQARRYEGRYLEVRYEDLLTDGPRVLRTVFDFIGESTAVEDIAAIYEKHRFENMKQAGTGVHDFVLPKEFFRKGQAGDWRNALSSVQRYLFDETAGDLLRALGYADNSWWYDRPYQRFTAPLTATLSSRRRMRMKAKETIKRALGPHWPAWVGAVRARVKQTNALEIRGKG
jgi:hypothetical protein